MQKGGFVWEGSLYGTVGSGGNSTVMNRIYGILSKYDDFNEYTQGVLGSVNLEGAEGRQSAINAAVNGWIAQQGNNLDENISKEIQEVLDNGTRNGYIVKVDSVDISDTGNSNVDTTNTLNTTPTLTTDTTTVNTVDGTIGRVR